MVCSANETIIYNTQKKHAQIHANMLVLRTYIVDSWMSNPVTLYAEYSQHSNALRNEYKKHTHLNALVASQQQGIQNILLLVVQSHWHYVEETIWTRLSSRYSKGGVDYVRIKVCIIKRFQVNEDYIATSVKEPYTISIHILIHIYTLYTYSERKQTKYIYQTLPPLLYVLRKTQIKTIIKPCKKN